LKRVLIVEDEGLIALLLEELMQRMGYDVVAVASTLAQALDLAGTAEIDFAMLDINLNGQESFPAAAILRERGIPVIFATGYGDSILGSEFADALVVEKPFNREELRRVLGRLPPLRPT
jgi:DNA-binding response OmpR family regulator